MNNDDDRHLTETEAIGVVNNIIEYHRLPDLCLGCLATLIGSLLGTIAYHVGNEAQERELFMNEVLRISKLICDKRAANIIKH